MRRDIPARHPLRIQRQHDLIHLSEPTLPLLHDLRFERTLPVPRHVNVDFAGGVGVGDHRFRAGPVAHVRRLTIRVGLVLLMPEVLGHLLVERGLEHGLGEQLQQAVRAGQRHPRAFASATIAAAAACSGDSSRAGFDSLLRGLTRSDVITHSAHPAGPRARRVEPETPILEQSSANVMQAGGVLR
jgi:hypothetical protein